MPYNNRLKLTAPSGHAFCFATGVEDSGPWGIKARPSARSLSGALAGFSYSSLAIASDMENA